MVRMLEYPQIMQSYTISTYGRVYDYSNHKLVAPFKVISPNKYLNASLRLLNGSKRTFDIHRMMLITFKPIEMYKDLVCNHIDGIKCHNWIWNLEWTDTAGNTNHAIENGLIRMGIDRANGVAPESLIRKICEMIQNGYSTYDIVNTITPSVSVDMYKLVNNIKNGHCHSNISKEYDFTNAWSVERDNRIFTVEQINAICQMLQDHGTNLSTKYICTSLGINYEKLPSTERERYSRAISSIKRRKHFTEITNNYNY